MGTSERTPPRFTPKFMKADLTFKVGGIEYKSNRQLVNVDGVAAFSWSGFDCKRAVGTKTSLCVQVLSEHPYFFECAASLACEETEKAALLGFTFELPDEIKATLDMLVTHEGIQPDYARKFPRIPFFYEIGIMPHFVTLTFIDEGTDISCVCELVNMSPSGLMVTCEDSRLAKLKTGEVVRIEIQPRGDFNHPITLNAAAKRILSSAHLQTGNRQRSVGLSVLTIDDPDRGYFAELLRNIALKFKSQS